MSAIAVIDEAGRRELKQSEDELLTRLFAGYRNSASFFRSSPTPERWRDLVGTYAALRVAFQSEDGLTR